MKVRKFFKKHPKLRHFLCPHHCYHEIGVLRCWDGNEWLIGQCEYCGVLVANEEPFWLPGELEKNKSVINDCPKKGIG